MVNQCGDIQYMCANVTDKAIEIRKGANIEKFTCISQKHQMYEIDDDAHDAGGICCDNECKQHSHELTGEVYKGQTDSMGTQCIHAACEMCVAFDDGVCECVSGHKSCETKQIHGSTQCAHTHNCIGDKLQSECVAQVVNFQTYSDNANGKHVSDKTKTPNTPLICTCGGGNMQTCPKPHGGDIQQCTNHTNTVGEQPETHKMSQYLDLSWSDLNAAQKQELMDLIDRYYFVFVGPDGKLGECKILPHKMYIDRKHKPIRRRYYRLGPKQKCVLEEMIADMKRQDIIQRSTSPWGAPCLLVCKPNNKGYRFVVDYRDINKLIELEATPLPTTEEALSSLGSSCPVYFTTLDLQSGFYQVTIDPESRPCTAFRSHLGLHEFKRLPMGLRNSPSTFQRVMEAVYMA